MKRKWKCSGSLTVLDGQKCVGKVNKNVINQINRDALDDRTGKGLGVTNLN